MSNLYVPQPGSDILDANPDFDGVATVLGIAPSSGIYTLNQNIIADTMTIRTGARVITAQYAIWARTLIIESGGFLSYNGNNASGATAGTGTSTAGQLGGVAAGGGSGASRTAAGSTAGNAGGGNTNGMGAPGGNGGAASAAGGGGGTSGATNASQMRIFKSVIYGNLGWRMPPITNATAFTVMNYTGGGGGGAVIITTTSGADPATGGGGGGGGGMVAFRVGTLRNLGTIEALGGNGGNASLGASISNGGAGGGGGGGGGIVWGSCTVLNSIGTVRVTGGTGGNGAQIGTTYTNRNGIDGGAGTVQLFVNGEPI